MKKTIVSLLAVFMLFALTACESKQNNGTPQNNTPTKETNKEEETTTTTKKQQPEENNDDYYDDEIVEIDDEDNVPYENEVTTVEKVINCDGCVYAYFSDEGDKAKRIGSTISPSDYTTDINNLRTAGGKQRHNFFGLVLSGNTISKAYACIYKDKKIYCIQGSDDGSHHTNNIAVLNQIFTSGQCRYISDGHTYTCTDGNYNGDTKTTGYASLHYETSCVIYGSDANSGKIICH